MAYRCGDATCGMRICNDCTYYSDQKLEQFIEISVNYVWELEISRDDWIRAEILRMTESGDYYIFNYPGKLVEIVDRIYLIPFEKN